MGGFVSIFKVLGVQPLLQARNVTRHVWAPLAVRSDFCSSLAGSVVASSSRRVACRVGRFLGIACSDDLLQLRVQEGHFFTTLKESDFNICVSNSSDSTAGISGTCAAASSEAQAVDPPITVSKLSLASSPWV